VNAFALPGGQIFITTTLLDQLENEAQLAGVLGHEIGHVIHRHSAEHMAKGQLGQSLVGAVAVGASGEDGAGRMAGMAAMMANNMLQLKYGRDDETESDATGIEYMVAAGYDPREMLGVMKVLERAGGGRKGVEWTQSHPLPQNRMDAIARAIEKNFTPAQLASLSKGQPLGGGAGEPRLAAERQAPARGPAGRAENSAPPPARRPRRRPLVIAPADEASINAPAATTAQTHRLYTPSPACPSESSRFYGRLSVLGLMRDQATTPSARGRGRHRCGRRSVVKGFKMGSGHQRAASWGRRHKRMRSSGLMCRRWRGDN
jgi:hypothetical protein